MLWIATALSYILYNINLFPKIQNRTKYVHMYEEMFFYISFLRQA